MFSKTVRALIVPALAISVFARWVPADIVVDLVPVADAFATSGQPNSNFGGAEVLSVAGGGSQGEFQSVMRFNSSVAKATFDSTYGAGQWTIQSIGLRLTAAAPNHPIFNAPAAGLLGVKWTNGSWTEGTGIPDNPGASGVTFSTLPVTPVEQALGDFAYSGATSGANTYGLALSPGLTAEAMAGFPLNLRLFAADVNISYLFRSRSFGTSADRPVLSITAIPEPSTLALTIACGSALLARRRR